MFQVLTGTGGAGKSHHAVWTQLLPALKRGTPIRTNMALKMHALGNRFPGAYDLIEEMDPQIFGKELSHFLPAAWEPILQEMYDTLEPKDWSIAWLKSRGRQLGVTMISHKLLVLMDEAHTCLGPMALGQDPHYRRFFSDFVSEHRHFGVNATLMTQKPLKIDPQVRGTLNGCVFISPDTKTGLGRYHWQWQENDHSDGTFTKSKTFEDDGHQDYEEECFRYYHSVTASKDDDGGVHKEARTVRPFWLQFKYMWRFYLAGFVLAVVIARGGDFSMPFSAPEAEAAVTEGEVSQQSEISQSPVQSAAPPVQGGAAAETTPPPAYPGQTYAGVIPLRPNHSIAVASAGSSLSGLTPGSGPAAAGGRTTLPPARHPLDGVRGHIMGVMGNSVRTRNYVVQLHTGSGPTRMSQTDLSALGYRVIPVSDCHLHLKHKSGGETVVTCQPRSL